MSATLAQIEIDLGPPEVPALEAEEPEAILGLAAQHMDRGEAAIALATIAQGLERYPDDPRLLERQADIYATLPFLQPQATEIYKRLLAQRPGDLALTNKLATTLLALGRLSQAEKLFQQVLAAEPDNAKAHLGLGRLYLRSAFYTMAQYHFEHAPNRMADSQEAREGLRQTQGLITPQLQALAGHFEDSAGFRRNFLYSGYRLYLHPRLRLYGGYGYLSYSSGPALFPKSNLGRTIHRHVLFLGLWQTGTTGRQVSLSHPEWLQEFQATLPDFTEADVSGSPFAVMGYTLHSSQRRNRQWTPFCGRGH